VLEELINLLKRSELIEELAESEIYHNVRHSDVSIRRAAKECSVTPFTRNEVDCEKAVLTNSSLKKIICQRDELLEQLKNHDTKELRDKIKSLMDEQIEIQNQIIKRFDIN